MATAATRLRLVGRGGELAQLDAELRRAIAGELRCVLLLADPGVGKTRLAAELINRHQRTIIALSARAYPLGATASFGLWVEAFERHLSRLPPAEIRALCGGVLDDLASVLRSVASVRGRLSSHETLHPRLVQGFAVLLRNLAEKAPVVVVLDDIHLADASSVEALNQLARNLSTSPVLIILAARPAELSQHPIARDALLALEQDGFLRRQLLTGLSREQVGELAAGVLEREPPAVFTEWLFTRSRGYPLFALGLVRTIAEQGGDLTAPTLERVPEELSDRVMSRLKQLDEPSLATLEVLALVGRRTELQELVSLTGRPLDRLAPILENLVRLRLLTEEERGRDLIYEVTHPLIEETIYQAIGGARRRAIHRLVARAFVASGQRAAAASHYVRCAQPGEEEAVDALIDALHQAEERQSYREAMPILSALLDLLPSGDPRWRRVLDAMDWDAEWVIDHQADLYTEIGVRAMREIEKVLRPSDDLLRQAVVQLRLSSFRVWHVQESADAVRSAERSRELFLRAGDRSRALMPLHEISWINAVAGDIKAQETVSRQVINEAEALGNRMLLLHALGAHAWSLVRQSRYAEAEPHLHRSIEIAREDGRDYRLGWSLGLLANCLSYSGRLDEAKALLDESRRATPAYGDTVLFAHITYVQWLAGDFRGARESWLESAAWNDGRLSARRAWGMGLAALSVTELGLTAEARDYLDRISRIFQGTPVFGYGHGAPWLAGMIARTEGDLREAANLFEHAITGMTGYGALADAAHVLLDLAEVAGELNDPVLGREAADRAHQISVVVEPALYTAVASIARAWAALLVQDPGGVESASKAVAILQGSGYLPFHARALDVLGRSLALSNRAAAADALQQAFAIFAACGAARRRERASEALEQLGHPGRRAVVAGRGPSSLTAREREVARLAIEGRTAREIGDRLFIGQRTVETHLANVYAKLGISTRLDLVRLGPDLAP
jgi:DNA-binding CsgD family transcriptional regulator